MRDRLVQHASLCANVAEILLRSSVIGIKIERLRQLRSGAIVLAAEKEKRPVMQVSARKKWVEFPGHARFARSLRFTEKRLLRTSLRGWCRLPADRNTNIIFPRQAVGRAKTRSRKSRSQSQPAP